MKKLALLLLLSGCTFEDQQRFQQAANVLADGLGRFGTGYAQTYARVSAQNPICVPQTYTTSFHPINGFVMDNGGMLLGGIDGQPVMIIHN